MYDVYGAGCGVIQPLAEHRSVSQPALTHS